MATAADDTGVGLVVAISGIGVNETVAPAVGAAVGGGVLEAFADAVNDKETVKLARGIRREEERMAGYLERLIPTLTKAVVRESVPSAERNGGRSRRRSSRLPTTSSGRAMRTCG